MYPVSLSQYQFCKYRFEHPAAKRPVFPWVRTWTQSILPPGGSSPMVPSLRSIGSAHFSLSRVWTAAGQASLSITNSRSLLKLMSIALVMPSNHLVLVIPFSSRLQSFPASGSFLMSRFLASGPKYWSFSFSISPSKEYSGLIHQVHQVGFLKKLFTLIVR